MVYTKVSQNGRETRLNASEARELIVGLGMVQGSADVGAGFVVWVQGNGTGHLGAFRITMTVE